MVRTKLHLTFVGVRNGGELAECFRPVVSEDEDIELFRHLLNPSLIDTLDLLEHQWKIGYEENAG